MTLEQQQQLEETYVMHTFGRKPVEFVRGEGMRLWDDEGNEYLDFLSGIGVVSLGHCHPALVEALQDQVATLMHVSNYFYIEGRGQLSERLSNLLKQNLSCAHADDWQTFYANSGAEANECAIKLAHLYARRKADAAGKKDAPRLIVVLEGSFHGRTVMTLAATAQPVKQELFQPLPEGFVPTPINDVAALERLFAEKGDQIVFFQFVKPGLVPLDDMSKVYDVTEASDFWTVVGHNTEYVISPEECMADNFSYAVVRGINPATPYNSPQLIQNIITALKR